MKDLRDNWIVQLLVHLLVFSVGVILLLAGRYLITSVYLQSVTANLGSSLISVTLLFSITRFFTPRQTRGENTEKISTSTTSDQGNSKITAYTKDLRETEVKQQPPVTTYEKKAKQ
jgi:K+-transporting ATPase c subunit